MRRIFRSRPVLTEETHRVTTFEIFFDLVFVFALTRLIVFMGEPPTFLSMAQGLLLLLLLMFSWSPYTWLGNQARADRGMVRAGMVIAMAAIFVAALVIPDAWRHGRGVNAPLTLVLAYFVVRALHLALYFYAVAEDRQLRGKLLIRAIPAALGWIPLVLGAVLGGTAQTLLWAAAFVIDIGGQRGAYALVGTWPLRSPTHFAERHGLLLIIAFGESLISVGTGAGTAVTQWPILVAALLGLTITVCLSWLYFENAAAAARQALAQATAERRDKIGSDAYSLGFLPLIAGVIYVALGVEQVLADLAHNQPHPAGEPLDWTSITALYGGVVLYLTGRLLLLRLAVRSCPPAQLAAAGVALLLLPVARALPALAALGLLTAFLIALVRYERLTQGSKAVTHSG